MYSDKEIMDRMLNNLENTVDKSENSIVYDVLYPSSIEMSQLHGRVANLIDLLDINKTYGEELTKWVYQRTGLKRKLSTQASGEITIIGTPNTLIPKETIFYSDDIPIQIKSDVKIALNGKVSTIGQCLEYGEVGNIKADTITRVEPNISGISSITNKQFIGGYNTETDEELRERYLNKLQRPAKAGNTAHYELWASEVIGVGNVKVYPRTPSVLHVTILVVDNNGLPASEELQTKVFDYIESQRPFGATVHIKPAKALNIALGLELKLLGGYDVDDIKQSITDEIQKYYKTLAFTSDVVSLAKITQLVLNTQGVIDAYNIKLNGEHKNIALKEQEIPVIKTIDIKGV